MARWGSMSAAAVFLLAACSDTDVTGPALAPVDSPAVQLNNRVELAGLLESERDRILASLPAGHERGQLDASLAALADAMSDGVASKVVAAVASANSAIDSFGSAQEADDALQAELGALRLTIQAIAVQADADVTAARLSTNSLR